MFQIKSVPGNKLCKSKPFGLAAIILIKFSTNIYPYFDLLDSEILQYYTIILKRRRILQFFFFSVENFKYIILIVLIQLRYSVYSIKIELRFLVNIFFCC